MARRTRTANPALAAAMRDIRRSSAAQPHRNRSKYRRTVKHRGSSNDAQ